MRLHFLLSFAAAWGMWSFVFFVPWLFLTTWAGFIWVSWPPVVLLVAVPALVLGLGLTVYCTNERRALA